MKIKRVRVGILQVSDSYRRLLAVFDLSIVCREGLLFAWRPGRLCLVSQFRTHGYCPGLRKHACYRASLIARDAFKRPYGSRMNGN